MTHDTEIYYAHKAFILILFFFHLSRPLLGLALHAGFLSFYCFVFLVFIEALLKNKNVAEVPLKE